jgi:hypothetical protein
MPVPWHKAGTILLGPLIWIHGAQSMASLSSGLKTPSPLQCSSASLSVPLTELGQKRVCWSREGVQAEGLLKSPVFESHLLMPQFSHM